MVEQETATRTLEETLREALPPATVVLHNDDVNSMDHVVVSLLDSVPELEPERAVEVMLAAHEHGSADVISCPLERAELYRDRLERHGLTATIRRS
ncbi:MAG: ATP-dependent Clp protease adaptor ClpS [Chloroflexi bacterium]|nr:MAG: ATP-dependent Clp protease adaptor ClpS [Chloroflexota bacterium]